MKEEYKKYGFVVIIIFLAILSLLYTLNNKEDGYEFTTSQVTDHEELDTLLEDVDIASDTEIVETLEIEKVPIYICGAVKNPDVYYLDQTTIIKEAIRAAGGFTDDADQEAWNLAMEIQKGEKIYVPKVGEQIDKMVNSYDNRVRGEDASTTARQLININKANHQELTLLPGIGPTIAQSIIDYRDTNGEFKTLQDVTNVPRIGQVTLEKIKDYICFQ